MQLIDNREQMKQNPSLTDQTGNKVYMPSSLPKNPNAEKTKVPEFPHNDNQKLFTREARDAVEGITNIVKRRSDGRGITDSKPLQQKSMSKKERRRQKWNNFKQGFKNGFGKIWNISKKIVPFIPGVGTTIGSGMGLAENAYNGLKNIFHRK